jgi:hypothetical protein
MMAAGGCASPGEPIERKPPIPSTIGDLAAEQAGNDVVLTFTIPKETVDHNTLDQAPSVEIFRSIHELSGTVPASSSASALLVTIPPAMVNTYITGSRFRYVDSLTAGDFLPNRQQSIVSYMVRTRASPKRESADSNRIELNIYPAPQPIGDLKTQATQSAILLSWTPSPATLTGETPVIAGYHVYRANAQSQQSSTGNTNNAPSSAATSASSSAASPQIASPLVEIGETTTPGYRDGDAQFDKSYVYSVRSTVQANGRLLESADSNLAAIALRDTFPPSAPTQLIATPVPTEEGMAAHVDLSWAINPETDVAGYNVYRSGQAGDHGTRQNPQLLPTPAFRDMNAVPGQSYFYTVTAVDRTGNESAVSPAVQASLPTGASATRNQASP